MSETKRHYIKDESLGGIEREYKEVGRRAFESDYIVITNTDMSDGSYGNGDILKARKRYNTGRNTGVHVDGIGIGIRDHEYATLAPTNVVRIDGYRFELIKKKAEVGDDVLVFNHNSGHDGVFNVDRAESNGHIHYGEYGRRPGGYYVLEILPDEPIGYVTSERGDIEKLTDMVASLAQEVAELKRKVGQPKPSELTATIKVDTSELADEISQRIKQEERTQGRLRFKR